MKLKINGNYYELFFGNSFIYNIDHELGLHANGQATDLMGLQKALPGLRSYDPSVLAIVIYCAIDKALDIRIINKYIEDCDDLEGLFTEVEKAMVDAKLVNFQAKRILGQTVSEIFELKPEKKSTSTKK